METFPGARPRRNGRPARLRQGCGGFGRSVSGGRRAGLYVRTNANQAL